VNAARATRNLSTTLSAESEMRSPANWASSLDENNDSRTGIGAIPLESAPLLDLHVRNPFNEAGATHKREWAS